MRVLRIILAALIGGSILSGIFMMLLMAIDEFLGKEGKVISAVLFPFALIGGYILAGWGYARTNPAKPKVTRDEKRAGAMPKSAAPMGEVRTGGSTPSLGVGIALAVVATLAVGIHYLESSAEGKARQFCEASKVGMPMANVAEAAKGQGTDMLRWIRPDTVSVGFTGLPPFSRHMCKVEGKGGLVASARYFHLD